MKQLNQPLRLLTISIFLVLAACTINVRHDNSSGLLQHVVVLWLKQPGDAEDRATIIAASRSLKTIPGVINVSVGTVLPSQRAIVDSSFDVALIITLPDRETMEAYLVHPKHRDLVATRLKPLVSRILVYDFVE